MNYFLKIIFIAFIALSTVLVAAIPSTSYAAEETAQEYIDRGLRNDSCRDPFDVAKRLFSQVNTDGEAAGPITQPKGAFESVECIIFAILNFGFQVALVIAGLLVAIGGIRYQLVAGQGPEKVEPERKRIQSALVGLALMFVLTALLNFVITFFELRLDVGEINIQGSGVENIKPQEFNTNTTTPDSAGNKTQDTSSTNEPGSAGETTPKQPTPTLKTPPIVTP